jgi:hypothetical protein
MASEFLSVYASRLCVILTMVAATICRGANGKNSLVSHEQEIFGTMIQQNFFDRKNVKNVIKFQWAVL